MPAASNAANRLAHQHLCTRRKPPGHSMDLPMPPKIQPCRSATHRIVAPAPALQEQATGDTACYNSTIELSGQSADASPLVEQV